MYLLSKMIFVGIAMSARTFRRVFLFMAGLGRPVIHDGETCYTHRVRYRRSEKTYWTYYNLRLRCASEFKLTREKPWDQFFKSLGLANEVKTGDPDFDQQLYVASDSEAFKRILRIDPEVRKAFLALFRNGGWSISCDGRVLRVLFPGAPESESRILSLAINLRKQLAKLQTERTPLFLDSFTWRAFSVEVIIWALAGYAFGVGLEWYDVRADRYLFPSDLVYKGLALAIVAAIFLLGLIAFLMRGSSRGHRILVESFFVLVVSLPLAGVGAIADLNSYLDTSNSVSITASVKKAYQTKRRNWLGRSMWVDQVELGNLENPSNLKFPETLVIKRALFERLQYGGLLKMEIGQGYLGHPWIRSIRVD